MNGCHGCGHAAHGKICQQVSDRDTKCLCIAGYEKKEKK